MPFKHFYQLCRLSTALCLSSALNNREHSVLREQFLELLKWRQLLCSLWDHFVELASLDELAHYVDAAYELSIEENLREGGPRRVKLEPLPYTLVLQYIECAEPVALGSE